MANVPVITQVAIVVNDLQSTMEALHRILGWGPWKVYEHRPPAYQELEYRGEPADYGVLGAEAQVGPIAFEILQPLYGASPYQEWLDEHGEGLHHVACMMPDDSEGAHDLAQRLTALGLVTLTSGRLADALDFTFIDAREQLGFILETGSGHSKELVTPIRTYPDPTSVESREAEGDGVA